MSAAGGARRLDVPALVGVLVERCMPEEMRDVERACFQYAEQIAAEVNKRAGQRIEDTEIAPWFVGICRTMLRSGGAGAS